MDNISPEEKLLRLIRGPRKQYPAADKRPISKFTGFKSRIIESVFYFIRRCVVYLNIRKIIRLGLVASAMYLIFSLIYPGVFLRNIKLPKPSLEKAVDLSAQPKSESKTCEFYLNGVGERQIFARFGKQDMDSPAINLNSNLIKDINLVGIISGADPQAIVENKKINKTYYLRKGQFIEGIQIEDIQEGKIILNFKGQKYELYI